MRTWVTRAPPGSPPAAPDAGAPGPRPPRPRTAEGSASPDGRSAEPAPSFWGHAQISVARPNTIETRFPEPPFHVGIQCVLLTRRVSNPRVQRPGLLVNWPMLAPPKPKKPYPHSQADSKGKNTTDARVED